MLNTHVHTLDTVNVPCTPQAANISINVAAFNMSIASIDITSKDVDVD